RDFHVTGVQTCALPISSPVASRCHRGHCESLPSHLGPRNVATRTPSVRSELSVSRHHGVILRKVRERCCKRVAARYRARKARADLRLASFATEARAGNGDDRRTEVKPWSVAKPHRRERRRSWGVSWSPRRHWRIPTSTGPS